MSVDFIKDEDDGEELNIHDYLVRQPLTTFFVKTEVDGPEGSGINIGDILVIDKSCNPTKGDMVIATKDEELIITNWDNENKDLSLWGVIIGLVRKF